jgi:glycosyltransferase involved in cell wall biosynthesis
MNRLQLDGVPGHTAANLILEKERGIQEAAVTVIVTLYNYSNFVTDCLASVHAQTLSGIDLVVVDDCSTDDSLQVVADWLNRQGDRFSRYRVVQHVVNNGLAKARNTAFRNARTPYVFVLDADNILYPRCLERLHSALQHCAASFAYAYAEKFGEAHGLTNYNPWNPDTFRINNTIDAMVLLRKAVWEQVGEYSTDMPAMGWEDFDLWFKIARAQGWGILVPEILTRYRVHGASMLNTVTNPNGGILWSHLQTTYPEYFPETNLLPSRPSA